jgi:SWI/SNF-related matrix-associated actin-dependent regulator 1 of chromatin subfamily A
VISYERLHAHRTALTAQTWECLILDEAHYVKNQRARRTRMILGEAAWGAKPKPGRQGEAGLPGLADRAERVWLLTGTPVANRPLDLFALLRALRHPLGDDQLAFGLKYCNAHQTVHGWDMRGASNVEDLRDRLLDVLLRRTKDEVLDLPPKLRTYMPVEVDLTAYRRVWLAHAEKMYALARAKRRYPRRTLLAEIAKLRHAAALAKIPAALALAEEMLEAGEKAVVFTLHRAVVKAFRERFAGRLATVVGGQTSRTRQAQVDAFETDPAIGLLVGDLRAAGHGFTLAAASQVVFVDYAWTPAEHLQAEDRAHRIGQTRAVTVTYLSAVGTIDEDVEQLLAQKLEIAGFLIDGVAPLGRMSFLDDLLAIVAKPAGP